MFDHDNQGAPEQLPGLLLGIIQVSGFDYGQQYTAVQYVVFAHGSGLLVALVWFTTFDIDLSDLWRIRSVAYP